PLVLHSFPPRRSSDLRRAPSGLRLAGVLTELGRHHAIVTLERRAQVLDELATHAPERLNLAPDLRFLAARALQDLLAVQLGEKRSEEHTSELQSRGHL